MLPSSSLLLYKNKSQFLRVRNRHTSFFVRGRNAVKSWYCVDDIARAESQNGQNARVGKSLFMSLNRVLRAELEVDGIGSDNQDQSQPSVSHCDLSGCGGPERNSKRPPSPSRVSAQCVLPGRRRGQIRPTHPQSGCYFLSEPTTPNLKI